MGPSFEHQLFPDSSTGKESACNAGEPSLIPGSGRSTGEGIGYPLQYSGLETSMDCIIHGGHKEFDWTERLSLSLSREIRWGKNQGYSKLLTASFLVPYILKNVR